MKGYKGFEKGLVCRGKQYEENTVFEENEAIICSKGMHFCENPFDVLDHYDLVNSDGSFNDFAEVEALAETFTDDNKKYCTAKLKIGAKLSFAGFVKACVDFVFEKINLRKMISDASGDYSKLAASGDYSKLAASGNASQLAASGDYSQLAASENYSKLAASGYASKLAASGDYSQLAASGDYSKLAASGYASKLAASGYASQLAASGYASKLAASENYSKLAASGDYSKLAASGYASKLAASGDYSQLAASGNASQLAASGDYSKLAASGDYSKLESTGEDCVLMATSKNSIAKAKKGSWVTLAEWKYSYEKERYVPTCVKTEFVDGENIKEDTFYKLIDGKFVEVF